MHGVAWLCSQNELNVSVQLDFIRLKTRDEPLIYCEFNQIKVTQFASQRLRCSSMQCYRSSRFHIVVHSQQPQHLELHPRHRTTTLTHLGKNSLTVRHMTGTCFTWGSGYHVRVSFNNSQPMKQEQGPSNGSTRSSDWDLYKASIPT